MQEFLVVINNHIDQEFINHSLERSTQYFSKFDLNFTCKTYLRNQYALLWFVKDETKNEFYEDSMTGNLIGCIGTWFFREKTKNNKKENPSLLLKHLLYNTEQGLSDIEGAYNFILYDASDKILKIITDRLGLSPLYVRRIGAIELISSSCLLLASLQPYELDPLGLQEFLLGNKFFDNTTLFQDIKKLAPASIIEYQQAEKRISSYWSIHFGHNETSLSTDQKVEKYIAELENITECIGALFTSPFLDLTGGWDSRTLLMMMLKKIPHFTTVTSGERDSQDAIVAQDMAHKLGIPHYLNRPFIISESFSVEKYVEYLNTALFLTDGAMSAPVYVHTFVNQSRNLMHGADISLNGSGGEFYRSYGWWSPARFYYSDFKHLNISIPGITTYYNKRELARRVMHQVSDLSIFTQDFDTDIYGHLISLFDKVNEPYMPIPNIDQITNIYMLYRMGNWAAGYSKATSRLSNCLSPLLMSNLLNIAIQITLRERAYRSFMRRVHKSVNPEIARMRTNYGYPTTPITPWNAIEFLPALKKKTKDTQTKILIKTGWKTQATGNTQPTKNLANIRKFLNLQPENMKLINIFNKQHLTGFLKKAKDENFPYVDFYHNIYTVEAILRILS